MTELTERQRRVLDLIVSSVAERGYPPTLREIGSRMGIRSTNGVNDHLRALERKGYIARSGMLARGMRIADKHVSAKSASSIWCTSVVALQMASVKEQLSIIDVAMVEIRSIVARIDNVVADNRETEVADADGAVNNEVTEET